MLLPFLITGRGVAVAFVSLLSMTLLLPLVVSCWCVQVDPCQFGPDAATEALQPLFNRNKKARMVNIWSPDKADEVDAADKEKRKDAYIRLKVGDSTASTSLSLSLSPHHATIPLRLSFFELWLVEGVCG